MHLFLDGMSELFPEGFDIFIFQEFMELLCVNAELFTLLLNFSEFNGGLKVFELFLVNLILSNSFHFEKGVL